MKTFDKKNLTTIVAVDTNLFFELVSKDENYVPQKKSKNGFYNTIRSMKRKCINGSLKIVILPQVWEEIKENLDNREKEFLQKYCLIVEPKNPEEYAKKVAKLATTYVKTGAMNDENENGSATSDAIIMAQSSVAGLNLVTCNYKHFLFYGAKNPKKQKIDRERADDIEEINSKFGLHFVMNNGEQFVPRPHSPAEYFELYRGGNFYEQESYEDIELTSKEIL